MKRKHSHSEQNSVQDRDQEDQYETESDLDQFTFELMAPSNFKPLGDLVDPAKEEQNDRLIMALGMFSWIEEKLCIQVVYYLDSADLITLSRTCRAFNAVVYIDTIWSDLYLHKHATKGKQPTFDSHNKFNFVKNFRTTLQLKELNYYHEPLPQTQIHSDFFYHLTLVNSMKIPKYWHMENINMAIFDISDFTKEIWDKYNKNQIPFVVRNFNKNWTHKLNLEYFRKVYDKTTLFYIGDGMWSTFEEYIRYANQIVDEKPFYMFDSKYIEKSNSKQEVVELPAFIEECLFKQILQADAPDNHWLIIGPYKSQSQWHVDPNCTSAWNLCLEGRKKWILNRQVPDGVFLPGNGTIAQPLSLVEWYMNHYNPESYNIEYTQEPGDFVFVPSGWYHCVLNLEKSNVALTSNFVNRSNYPKVKKYLEDPDLLSGFNYTVDKKQLLNRMEQGLKSLK